MTTPADPHHDPRPWETLNEDYPLNAGDEVRLDHLGITTTAVVASVDEEGDPWTDEHALIGIRRHGTWYVRRRIPASTPPAEEVELPGEHPAHILDVEDAAWDMCAYMAMNRFGGWIGVDQDGTPREWTPEDITAFALPDGTRARRDGKRLDGTPRFVKEADA